MPNTIERLYTIGYTSLRARMAEMDTISDNLANVNTAGFKERKAGFQAALGIEEQGERRGVELSAAVPDMSQGPIQITGQTWDLAIDGDGFFALRMPDGTRGYTRLGVFHLDGGRRLVNGQGLVVEPALTVPADVENVMVDAQGIVTGSRNGVPQTLARLQLARFANSEGLLDQGGGTYMPSAASGPAITGAPTENGMGEILSGALESSNVDTAQQMITMVRTQRAYGLTLRALQVSDQMSSLTNQLQA
jgi:flagellar basal-body rod protein FlgG